MEVRLAVIALALGGCELVFPLRDRELPDGAVQDGTLPDMPADGCLPLSIAEDFDGPSVNPCGQAAESGMGVTRALGQLRFQPPMGIGVFGACTTEPIQFTQAFVEVPQGPIQIGMFAELAITDATNTYAITAERIADGSRKLIARANGVDVKSVNYQAAVQAWWRLRAVGGQVNAETSPDGVIYGLLAERLGSAPMNVSVVISGGIQSNSAVASPSEARMDNLGVCP